MPGLLKSPFDITASTAARPRGRRACAVRLVAALAALHGTLAMATAARATTVAHASVEQIARASHLVAVITVLHVQPRLRRGEIVTDVHARVDLVARGERSVRALTVVLPGGALDGRVDSVDGVPAVRPAQTMLAFLRRLPAEVDGPDAYALAHLTAGLLPVEYAGGDVTLTPAPGARADCSATGTCPPGVLHTRDTALRTPAVSLVSIVRALERVAPR